MKKLNKKFICFAIACQFLIVTFISSPLLSVKANTIKDEVHISVSDATGEKTSFNYSPGSPSFTEKSDIVLKGESYGAFSINPSKYNTLQYKIVKSITDSSLLNSEGEWKDINLNEQENNNDVLTDKKGFLKHRAYDVNHLDSLKDAVKWNDRKTVYETPYSSSSIISAKRSERKEEYGHNENYLKANKKQTRWVNNSIFLKDTFIDNKYKEASKIWGYIKVDESGEYNFQSFSDDGLSASIKVDGVEHKIVDGDVMFKLHGRNGIKYKAEKDTSYKSGYEYGYNYELTKGSNNTYEYTTTGSLKSVKLNKDKYYPIYIEYFNWGGGAALEMNFKKANQEYDSYKQIPASNFYPSKSDYPGEYADSIFTGTDGVKLPTESGRYYIAYRAINKDATGKITAKGEIQGTLGPYLVEPRAKLNISKDILLASGEEVPLVDNKYSVNSKTFKVRYNIEPLPITLEELIADVKVSSDINKAPEKYTMTISDSQIAAVLPEGLDYANIKENSVVEGKKSYNSVSLNSIVYELDKKDKVYKPITNKISFTHTIKAESYGEYALTEDYSKLTYKDVDGGNRELKFNTQNLVLDNNTDIIENALYNASTNTKQTINNKTVIKTMIPSTFALQVKVNSLSPKINIKIEGIEKSKIQFIKYELNNNGEINKATKESQSVEGNEFKLVNEGEFKLEINKQYLIIYEIKPKKDVENISIVASDENRKKEIKQIIKAENPPILK